MHWYITEQNSKLTRQSKRLILVDRQEEPLKAYPLLYVDSIHVFGNVQVTSQALRCCCYHQRPVSFYILNGHFLYMMTPPANPNFKTRLKQVDLCRDADQAFQWTKQTVAAKLQNELTVVTRFRNRTKTAITKDEIALKGMLKRISNVGNGQKLLGFEGIAAQKYWALLRLYYKGQITFGNRSR
jgi:CRISPR-associated protein Cas1